MSFCFEFFGYHCGFFCTCQVVVGVAPHDNAGVAVPGAIIAKVKGGYTVDIGVKAFLPGSQVDLRPVRNLDGMKGHEIEVRVIKLNKFSPEDLRSMHTPTP